MLDGLAFLPIGDVVSGIQYLRVNTPDGLEPLIDYFDSTYISGQFRRIPSYKHNQMGLSLPLGSVERFQPFSGTLECP